MRHSIEGMSIYSRGNFSSEYRSDDGCDGKAGPSSKEFSPAQFYKFYWEKSAAVSPGFFIYRWITTIFIVGHAVASMFERDPLLVPTLFFPKYFIYLTNWSVWMCAIQAILALWIVNYYYFSSRNSEDLGELDNDLIRNLGKLYKATHTIAVVSLITVTLVYWPAVFDPHRPGSLNIFTIISHGVLAALVLLDAIIVAHPFKLSDFSYVFLFSIAYATFSFVYFHLGGTNRDGETFIYNILDWECPVCAFQTCALIVLLQLFNHLVVWLIASFVKGD